MKKKTKMFIAALAISLIFSIGAIYVVITSMFKAQYNSNGISHFLVVTIDGSQMQYIGDLEGHKVYIEGFNIDETVFRSIKAENVSIKYALENELVSIEDWEKHALSIKKISNDKILKFDNYEIYVNKEICIIRPLTK